MICVCVCVCVCRWVKTTIIELEALCRGRSTLKLKDPDTKRNQYRGELVPYNCVYRRQQIVTRWHFDFHVTVHSWVPGDAFAVKDSGALAVNVAVCCQRRGVRWLSKRQVRLQVRARCQRLALSRHASPQP